MAKILYFAYGSNMALERLQARVPSAEKICNAYLPGYQLNFHKHGNDDSGKCDIVETGCDSDSVHGVIFEFLIAEKPLLDICEAPKYVQRDCVFYRSDSEHPETIDAYLYIIEDKHTHTKPGIQPFHWYKQHVVYGAQSAGLPLSYIEALEAVAAIDDPDEQRTALELSVYA